ncbi:MAG: hypothetical protein ACO1OY_08845 [Ramlibacter sp.]
MKHAVEPPLTGALSIFERTCAYCGARFRVLAARGREGDTADYACPDCGKTYEAQAIDEPEVQLLGRRTDGKDDRYQETMF